MCGFLTTAGCTNECFLDIQNVPDETAEVITGGIISIIESRGIDFSKLFGWPLMELAICLVTYLEFRPE